MSAKHTKGPWRYIYEPGYYAELMASDHATVALFAGEPSLANARRIVACVNACEGFSIEELEGADLFKDSIESGNLINELLEALKLWLDIHDKPAGFIGKFGKSLTEAIAAQEVKVNAAAAAARAAIAKAQGDQQ